MKNWYVLFLRGGKEFVWEEFLNEQSDNLRAFIPKIEVVHRKQGISTLVKKPMFPSYLFVESEMDQSAFSAYLMQLRNQKEGLIKELKYDNEETPALQENEKAYLEKLLDKEDVLKHSTGMIENDKVIVTSGPLIGYESQIIHIDRHKRQATLRFSLLGEERDVKVSLEIIKKI